jgi:hypothetical protein
MRVAKITAYAVVTPINLIATIYGSAAQSLSALTGAGYATLSLPEEPIPEPEPEPDPASVRLVVSLIGTERRTIALNGTVLKRT